MKTEQFTDVVTDKGHIDTIAVGGTDYDPIHNPEAELYRTSLWGDDVEGSYHRSGVEWNRHIELILVSGHQLPASTEIGTIALIDSPTGTVSVQHSLDSPLRMPELTTPDDRRVSFRFDISNQSIDPTDPGDETESELLTQFEGESGWGLDL